MTDTPEEKTEKIKAFNELRKLEEEISNNKPITWQQKLNEKRVKDKGWYGCIAPDGWKEIVLRADEMLSHIDPDYQIFQIKEKFGTLRYYFGSTHEYDSVEYSIMRAIESWAERRSESTCESCGKYGELRTERYWIVTLCDTCNEEREYEQPHNSDN